MKQKIFIEIVVFLYICLMLYTAASKLMDYQLTREQMSMMPLLKQAATVVVWLLPLTEIIIAVLLFFPKTRIKGLKTVTSLMIFFCIYIIYMMSFYKDLPCSCGGFLETLTWSGHLILNGVFIALGIIALFLLSNERKNGQSAEYYVTQ